MSTQTEQKFEELLDSFQTAMLVTQSGDGQLRSRPMALAHRSDDSSALFFATKADSEKVDEILEHPGVNVSMQKSSTFLTVSGKAEVLNDQDRIEELWEPSWKLWFEEGKEDPSIVLIKVDATRGEYWNFDTADKLDFLFEAGKAVLKGEAVEYDAGEHAKVRVA